MPIVFARNLYMQAKKQVHLDFHNSGEITHIGQHFDTQDFVTTLKNAHIDSITCFAKCHHGYLYYDTDLDEQHPHLDAMLLDEQYHVLKENNINMPVYISVGFDELQAFKHPEWIAINEHGQQIKEFGSHPFDAGWHWLCLNNDYEQKILEVIEDLENRFDAVDGYFFDIITQPTCSCHFCKQDMIAQGLDFADSEVRERFARNVEARFKAAVVAKIKSRNPNATIFFNGLVWNTLETIDTDNYTHLEIESLASGLWGYEHYPLVVKSLAHQPLETIAMTARFHKSWADFGGYKTAAALEYEIVRGAFMSDGISIGDQLHPLGMMDKKAYEIIEIANKKAAPILDATADSRPLVEVGIVYDASQSATRFDAPSSYGAAIACRELHLPFNHVSIHDDWDEYKLLIFPDHLTISNQTQARVARYVERGGKILASYRGLFEQADYLSPTDFLPILDAKVSKYEQDYLVKDETSYIMYESGLHCHAKEDVITKLSIQNPYFDRTYKHFSSHFQTPNELKDVGNGWFETEQIIYLSHKIFSLYKHHGNECYFDIIKEAIEQLYTSPIKVNASKNVLYEMRTNGLDTFVALFNYQVENVHNIATVKDIESVTDITLEVAQNNLTLQMIGGSDAWYSNGLITLSKLHGYSIFKLT